MTATPDILAIIPARGGSKGLADKNMLPCAGKPLLQWTLEAARDARCVNHWVLSTDSQAIADKAAEAGFQTPWLRPAELAKDESAIEEVVRHALAQAEQEPDLILLLQPTSPLRTAAHIDQAVEQFLRERQGDDETLVSVTRAPSKARWILEANDQGYVRFPLLKTSAGVRRQDLPPSFYPNGAIYLSPAAGFSGFYTSRTRFFEMDPDSSTDIDSEADLAMAEKLLLARRPA